MNCTTTNFKIFCVLIQRNVKILFSNFWETILDCISPLFVQVITFGYLFPLIGMPSSMVAPVFLGSMVPLFMQLGFALVMRTAFDLQFSRFIDYQLTLPLSKRWLFGSFIVNHMIEVGSVTFPLYVIGIFLLHDFFALAQLHWFTFFIMYIIVLWFFSTFKIMLSLLFSLDWVLDNIWPRILVPLYWLGCVLMVWKQVYAWSPLIGSIMLLSPFTYIAEGIRASLLGSDMYIPWYLCALALIGYSGINLLLLYYGLRKKLDPV